MKATTERRNTQHAPWPYELEIAFLFQVVCPDGKVWYRGASPTETDLAENVRAELAYAEQNHARFPTSCADVPGSHRAQVARWEDFDVEED